MEKSFARLQPFGADGLLHAVIEAPKGGGSKFKYDPELGLFVLHRSLSQGMVFPCDFGFIPSTLGEDGDPLDVLVLVETETFPGCLIRTRLIGVIEAEQRKDGQTFRNDRFIAVHPGSAMWGEITEIDQLPEEWLNSIEQFFIAYHHWQGQKFTPLHRGDSQDALALIQDGTRCSP